MNGKHVLDTTTNGIMETVEGFRLRP